MPVKTTLTFFSAPPWQWNFICLVCAKLILFHHSVFLDFVLPPDIPQQLEHNSTRIYFHIFIYTCLNILLFYSLTLPLSCFMFMDDTPLWGVVRNIPTRGQVFVCVLRDDYENVRKPRNYKAK